MIALCTHHILKDLPEWSRDGLLSFYFYLFQSLWHIEASASLNVRLGGAEKGQKAMEM